MSEMDAAAMVNGLLEMVDKINVGNAVNKGIDAYDHYATAAMTVLAEMSQGSDEETPENADWKQIIAAEAWALADAMMAERRKRGLGGVMPPSPEQNTRVVFDGNGGSGGESS
jgi:hypothetical protein